MSYAGLSRQIASMNERPKLGSAQLLAKGYFWVPPATEAPGTSFPRAVASRGSRRLLDVTPAWQHSSQS